MFNHKLAFAAIAMLSTTAVCADPVHGIWQTQPGDSGGFLHVQISDCEGLVCGTIVKIVGKDGRPRNTYDFLGKKMIWDMQVGERGIYDSGKIWAPDKNKTYQSKMQLDGDTLTVKGCVAGGWICRGQDWTRVSG